MPEQTADETHDINVFKVAYAFSIDLMNSRQERFPHPVAAWMGGVIGNNIYKYHRDKDIAEVPAGPLLTRLFPGYENIKECYDQADTTLREVNRSAKQLKGKWKYGIVSYPGHYWGCAKNPAGTVFVHMDPWKDDFRVTSKIDQGTMRAVSWEDWNFVGV
jgi:hypothetical protein